MTEQSNALQLFQFGESIFYAFLNYLSHEVTTPQPTESLSTTNTRRKRPLSTRETQPQRSHVPT